MVVYNLHGGIYETLDTRHFPSREREDLCVQDACQKPQACGLFRQGYAYRAVQADICGRRTGV